MTRLFWYACICVMAGYVLGALSLLHAQIPEGSMGTCAPVLAVDAVDPHSLTVTATVSAYSDELAADPIPFAFTHVRYQGVTQEPFTILVPQHSGDLERWLRQANGSRVTLTVWDLQRDLRRLER